MTSKISFRKMLRLELRQRSWLAILIFAASVLLIPVYYGLELAQIHRMFRDAVLIERSALSSGEQFVYILQNTQKIMGADNHFLGLCVIIAAVLAAFSGFSFLYSREKTDFVFSLPVRRETIFAVRYFGGILLAVLPYLVCEGFAIFVLPAFFGCLKPAVVVIGLKGAVFFLAGFFGVYSFGVVAVLLTGRYFTGLLMTAFFLGYGPFCFRMVGTFASVYFPAVYQTEGGGLYRILSPFSALVQTAPVGISVLIFLAAFVIGTVFAVLLIRLRPAETAGNAFISRKMIGLMKVFLSLPVSLLFAYVLLNFSGMSGETIPFMVFALLGAVLFNGILEFLVSMEMRNLLRGWKSGVVAVLLTICAAFFFAEDPFALNTWIPEKDRVEAMSFASDAALAEIGEQYGYAENRMDMLARTGWQENFSALYDLAAAGVANLNHDGSIKKEGYMYDSEGNVLDSSDAAIYDTIIGYRLKSGRTVYRHYNFSLAALEEAAEQASTDRSFREVYYPGVQEGLSQVNRIDVRGWNYGSETKTAQLNAEESRMLLEAVKEDVPAWDYRTLKETDPVGILNLYADAQLMEDAKIKGYDTGNTGGAWIYLYPQYKKTLQALRQIMGDSLSFLEQTEEVRSVSVDLTEDGENAWLAQFLQSDTGSVQVTDPDRIRKLLACTERSKNPYVQSGEDVVSISVLAGEMPEEYVIVKVVDREKFISFLQEEILYDEEQL